MFRKILIPGMTALLFATIAMFAQQETTENGTEDAGEENATEEKRMPVPLGQNVKLEFSLEPSENNSDGLCITTAVSLFETSMSYDGENGEWYFSIEGETSLTDGKILVIYEASLSYSGENESSELWAKSGVLLNDGQSLEIATFGDRALMISASIVSPGQKP